MNGFNFHVPTEIIFGKGAELQAGSKLKSLGKKNILIIYGGGSALKSGLIEKVENSLREEGLNFITIGGVKPNPMLSFVRKAIQTAKENSVDFVLAVGGGSVIDTAKAVSHGLANPDDDVWQFFTGEKKVQGTIGIGSVLTISAAGSETSDSCVITNDDGLIKKGLNTQFNRPVFTLMNPENTYSLPAYQIACGVVDIMMHTMERYFTKSEGNALTDQIAESLIRVTVEKGKIAMEDSHNYDAMSELMWCGSLSHNGITGLGAVGDWAVHQMGHELSGLYDVAHAAALSSIWDSWAKYVYKEKPSRFAKYAKNISHIDIENDEEAALAAIEKTESFFKSINMPTSLSDLRIGKLSDEDLRIMANRCAWQGKRTVGQFKTLGAEDIYQIYKMANDK